MWSSSQNPQDKKPVPPIKVPPTPAFDLAQNSVRTDNGSIIGDMGVVTQSIWGNKQKSESPSPGSNNQESPSKGGGFFGKVVPPPAAQQSGKRKSIAPASMKSHNSST